MIRPNSFAPLVALALAPSIPSMAQPTGARAPSQQPALSAPASADLFTVPDGFEVRLFAAEPMVVNPVAMSWDERGRLYVLELFEYPLGAKEGETPRDRIKILEDTDGDEIADKVTVFADGLNLATGLLVGNGGVYVGQAPDLLFLQDTDGDDVADSRDVLLTGFGLEDRHELLNGFEWGPDGWIYMTHGVFTHSKVVDPNDPEAEPAIMNAAVARFHPQTRQFEVFSDGTSNPWGVDFDANYNLFVTACVIDHMFFMAPGGHYVRQAGAPENPFGYGRLPSIVDHRHFRAAFCGVQVYNGSQYPDGYAGQIFQGNIHGNSVHQDHLERKGASFLASFEQDFLTSEDEWFRPVATKTGPDGCLWIMDWHDKYPCYQNAKADPEGVDRSHGRIWRVVHGDAPVATTPENDLATLGASDLTTLLSHPNNWQRRTARRLLSERGPAAGLGSLEVLLADVETLPAARLESLLALHGAGLIEDSHLDAAAASTDEALRIWAARLTGDRADGTAPATRRLVSLASDDSPQVRLAVATALRQHTSGALTIDRPVPDHLTNFPVFEVLTPLTLASAESASPVVPFLIWMALEPVLAADPAPALSWLAGEVAGATPLVGILSRKAMLRLCDLRDTGAIDQAADFLARAPGALQRHAVDGLLDGQRGGALPPESIPDGLFDRLREHADPQRVDRLAALWGDPSAVTGTLRVATDPGRPESDRVSALETARQFKSPEARDLVTALVAPDQPDAVATAALRTLRVIGDDATGAQLVERWGTLPAHLRRETANTLVLRPAWKNALVSALETNTISASAMPAPVVRSLLDEGSGKMRKRARAVVGTFRPSPGDIANLIAKKREVVAAEGPVDIEQGRLLATGACLSCHQLHGTGQEVGPDLTGVGRSTLDALLANIIDPNQIIGLGYELTVIETDDGRTLSGRLMENSDAKAVLRIAGGAEETIPKDQIANLKVTGDSVMPTGLGNLPDEQFRNLVWYILNPPEDGREMTPELRRQLVGEAPRSAAPKKMADRHAPNPGNYPPIDRESVALWAPEWKVEAPDFEGSPNRVPLFRGREGVLRTHPTNPNKPAFVHRKFAIPADKKVILKVATASLECCDWLLAVRINGKITQETAVDDRGDEAWTDHEFDLSEFGGKTVDISLENVANDWSGEFGYWQRPEIVVE